MRFLIFIFVIVNLYATGYKNYKIMQFLDEIKQRHIKFLPLVDYNIFPVNIDNKVKIQQYIKAQSESIKLSAIAGDRAYINGKWYKIHDNIGNLVIENISNGCVFFLSKDIEKKFKVCLVSNLIKVGK